MKGFLTVISCIFCLVFISFSTASAQSEAEEGLRHHHLVLTLGHAHIPSADDIGDSGSLVLIPTWGFSYEYLFNRKFGLGLKGDLEVSNYIVTNNEGREIERENPFSLSLVAIYNPIKGFGLFIGPGIEYEKDENFFIAVVGVSYEAEFGDRWDFSPELSYELKEGHTGAISIGFSIGMRVGNMY